MLVRVWDEEEKLWILEELVEEPGRCERCSTLQDKLFIIQGDQDIPFCGYCLIETYKKVEVVEE